MKDDLDDHISKREVVERRWGSRASRRRGADVRCAIPGCEVGEPVSMAASGETNGGGLLGSGPFLGEVAQDLRTFLRGHPGWVAGIAVNAVLAICYLAYYRSTANLPERGLVYSGAAIAAWILADTLTTNQLVPEAERAATALNGGIGIGRILLLKNLSLGSRDVGRGVHQRRAWIG